MQRFNKKVEKMFGKMTLIERVHYKDDKKMIKVDDLIDSMRQHKKEEKIEKIVIKNLQFKSGMINIGITIKQASRFFGQDCFMIDFVK